MDTIGADGARWANPKWQYPEYPPGSVVELRVHGVGGEPPSAMTRDRDPVLVGGSRLAGFFRARNPVIGELGDDDGGQVNGRRRRPLHVREVLSWGGQTSGTTRHALWVLLLPFALFNVAGRMHRPGGGWRATGHRAICRLLALTMTLAVVAITGGVAFDLVAVQCGAWGEACLGTAADGPALLAPFRRFDDDVVGRLGLAALLPTAIVVALWYAGRYRTGDLEGYAAGGGSEAVRRADEPTSLADPDFWRNAWPASRLRAVHATAAFALVTATLGTSLLVVLADRGGGGRLIVALVVVAGGTVLLAGALTATVRIAAPGPDPALHATLAVLRFLGLGGLGFLVGVATLGDVAPGYGRVTGPVGVALVAVVGAALVVGWVTGFLVPRQHGVRVAPYRIGDRSHPGVSIGTANAVLAAGTVLLGWAAGHAGDGLLPRAVDGQPPLGAAAALPGVPTGLMEGVFAPAYVPLLALVLVQTGLVLGLAVVSVGPSAPPRKGRNGFDLKGPVPFSLAAVVVALLSLLLITAIGAGLHAVVLDALGDQTPALVPERAGDTDPEPFDRAAERHRYGEETGTAPATAQPERVVPQLTLPWWHAITALTVAGTLVVAGAAAPVWLWWCRRRRPTTADVAAHLTPSYQEAGLEPPDPADPADARQLRDVGGAWMWQRIIRGGGQLLAGIVAVVLVAVVAVLWRYLASGAAGRPVLLTTPSVLLLSLVPLAGVALLRRSLKDPETRRAVGGLWDVLTFWPRVTHPFAPPAYGEAVVPMLERKVRSLVASDRGYRVVLAGHSQGSVLALAAVARLPSDGPRAVDRRRLALVTYGSPIAILYERYYPASLQAADAPDVSVLDHVLARVRSWHHLFALTEPFAYPYWEVSTEASPQPADPAAGWSVSRALPFVEEACPACVPGEVGGRAELLVRDPDRWRLPDGRLEPPGGHSSYHRHPDVDRHLADIAACLASEPMPTAPLVEQRADRWWRAVP